MRFDQLVRGSMIVRDVKQQHPESVPVFENLGFRPACDDCSIEQVARKQRLRLSDVLDEVNRAIFGQPAEEAPRPSPTLPKRG